MFRGSYVAMVTPFNNGNIDEKALIKMVNWQIENGTSGLVPMGTTGEASTVTSGEHKQVLRVVIDAVAGRIPVIAGAGSNNPVEALDYAESAQELGADGILCVAGYYNRPSQLGLYEHFKYIHDNTDIPIIIYNVPPRTSVDIQPETMAKLAQLSRVSGVKDATADLSRISLEQLGIDKSFSYLSGEDMTAIAYNAMGGNGCISVTANVAPKHCALMQKACADGDYQSAFQIHQKLVPIHRALFVEPSPAGVKYAASLLGLCSEETRLPIIGVSPQTKIQIEHALKKLA